MTKEEKEIIIDLFNSFKYIPTLNEECTERENGINEGIGRCIDEIQNFGCGENAKNQEEGNKCAIITQDRIDWLLEKYTTWLLDEQDLIEENKTIIKKCINSGQMINAETLISSTNKKLTRVYVLKEIVNDLESLRSKDEKH